MENFSEVEAAMQAARDRLPPDLAVESLLVLPTADMEGADAAWVGMILKELPEGGLTPEHLWAAMDVLEDAARDVRPGLIVLPHFATSAEVEELEGWGRPAVGAGAAA